MTPKDEYTEPVRTRARRWSYGFEWMDIGEQMRCPLMENETPKRAQVRVASAALCWKKKNKAEERAHIKFRSQMRGRYILIERIS